MGPPIFRVTEGFFSQIYILHVAGLTLVTLRCLINSGGDDNNGWTTVLSGLLGDCKAQLHCGYDTKTSLLELVVEKTRKIDLLGDDPLLCWGSLRDNIRSLQHERQHSSLNLIWRSDPTSRMSTTEQYKTSRHYSPILCN